MVAIKIKRTKNDNLGRRRDLEYMTTSRKSTNKKTHNDELKKPMRMREIDFKRKSQTNVWILYLHTTL